MNRKGFTLVELIATIVVLGLIMSVVLIGVNGGFGRAKDKSEDVFVGTIKDAMDIYLDSTIDVKEDLKDFTKCDGTIDKTYGSVNVYEATITFDEVINSQYYPITQADLVNPVNETKCALGKDIIVNIYRDADYVYYYSIDKDEFNCLLNDENKVKEYDEYDNPIYYSSVISNLIELVICIPP